MGLVGGVWDTGLLRAPAQGRRAPRVPVAPPWGRRVARAGRPEAGGSCSQSRGRALAVDVATPRPPRCSCPSHLPVPGIFAGSPGAEYEPQCRPRVDWPTRDGHRNPLSPRLPSAALRRVGRWPERATSAGQRAPSAPPCPGPVCPKPATGPSEPLRCPPSPCGAPRADDLPVTFEWFSRLCRAAGLFLDSPICSIDLFTAFLHTKTIVLMIIVLRQASKLSNYVYIIIISKLYINCDIIIIFI